MPKLFFLVTLLIIFFTPIASAQERNSIQVNAGLVYPSNSSDGLIGTAQFSYPVNEQISFYVYTGYAEWDKHYVGVKPTRQAIMDQEDHRLIPFYLGSRINLHTNDFMTSFLNFEIGYSILEYRSYTLRAYQNPENGELIYQAGSFSQDNRDNLFGIGIGAGLSHPISALTSLVFTYKLNALFSPNYYALFDSRGISSSVSVGFNFYL